MKFKELVLNGEYEISNTIVEITRLDPRVGNTSISISSTKERQLSMWMRSPDLKLEEMKFKEIQIGDLFEFDNTIVRVLSKGEKLLVASSIFKGGAEYRFTTPKAAKQDKGISVKELKHLTSGEYDTFKLYSDMMVVGDSTVCEALEPEEVGRMLEPVSYDNTNVGDEIILVTAGWLEDEGFVDGQKVYVYHKDNMINKCAFRITAQPNDDSPSYYRFNDALARIVK